MDKREKNDNELLNVQQTADRFGVSSTTVQKYIRNGKLPNATIITRRLGYRIPLSDVEQLEQQIKKDNNNLDYSPINTKSQ